MKKEIKKKFDFIDLFAGIGGFHIAMHENGGNCVFASEIDRYARQTYENNFKSISPELFKNGQFNKDITDVDYNTIPEFDVLCAGFPCQAFSIAGYRKGFDDDKGRGNLFFNIYEILKVKNPKAFILENVKNLVGHDEGRTFQTICSFLTELGYGIKYQVLNAKNYGLNQNRERIFIVGTKNSWIGNKIPLPSEVQLSNKELDEIIYSNNKGLINSFLFENIEKVKSQPFYDINNSDYKSIIIDNRKATYFEPSKNNKKYFQNYNDRSDWKEFIYNGKGGHFKKVVDYINQKTNSSINLNKWENWDDVKWEDNSYEYIYQWRRKYVRRNEGGVSPTLTANMGTGGHNVPLIICGIFENGEKIIRKLTPEECFAIQGFDREIIKKISKLEISNGQKYKQAGNSVPVDVVKKITSNLISIIHD